MQKHTLHLRFWNYSAILKHVARRTKTMCSMILLSSLISSPVNANSQIPTDNDLGKWSAMFYFASTANKTFGDVIIGNFSRYGESLYAIEGTYTLDEQNRFRQIFAPIFDTVQLAGNITYRHDYHHHDNVAESNLFVIWRFSRFPWNKYLRSSIAIGDGLSHAFFHTPYADREVDQPNSDYSKFLNYLMLEATFALPAYPHWQLALRIHHRCTAWGTFPKNANAGSTSVGIGIRYYF